MVVYLVQIIIKVKMIFKFIFITNIEYAVRHNRFYSPGFQSGDQDGHRLRQVP